MWFFLEKESVVRPASVTITTYLPFPLGSYHSYPLSHLKQQSTQLNSFGGGGGGGGGGGKAGYALKRERGTKKTKYYCLGKRGCSILGYDQAKRMNFLYRA